MTTGPQDPSLGGQEPGQPNPYPGGPSQSGNPQQPYGGQQQPYGNPQQPHGYPQQPYGGQQQPYPAGMNQMAAGPGRPGDLGLRFAARLLDSVIVGVPVMIVSAIFLLIGVSATIGLGGSERSFSIGFWIGGVILSAFIFVAWVGYFVYMEAYKGQTLGKQIVGLRTEGPNGGNPTIEQAVKRNAYVVLIAGGGLISSIVALGSVLDTIGAVISGIASVAAFALIIVMAVTISSSPTKQGKHDEFAGGTRVVTTK